jgi:hypothetical protein
MNAQPSFYTYYTLRFTSRDGSLRTEHYEARVDRHASLIARNIPREFVNFFRTVSVQPLRVTL